MIIIDDGLEVSKEEVIDGDVREPMIPDYSLLSPCKKCVVRVVCKIQCPPHVQFLEKKKKIKKFFKGLRSALNVVLSIVAILGIAVGLVWCMGMGAK